MQEKIIKKQKLKTTYSPDREEIVYCEKYYDTTLIKKYIKFKHPIKWNT